LTIVVILLLSIFVTPSIGLPFDDTTPPVTTHTLAPPEPDGLNGWYVSDVNVTLTATDDRSGVKEIRYMVDGGPTQVISGDNGSFILDEDGWRILIEYWAIDNAGNVETPKNELEIYIDQTVPDISISYEVKYYPFYGWTLDFTAVATDAMSGMEYVEFYMNKKLQKTVYGSGPDYEWIWDLSNISYVRGFIRKPMITDENVSFLAVMVITFEGEWMKPHLIPRAVGYDEAGLSNPDEPVGHINYPTTKLLLLKDITLPNDYRGFIGNNFIFARFNSSEVN
jgi:hypothetical protein